MLKKNMNNRMQRIYRRVLSVGKRRIAKLSITWAIRQNGYDNLVEMLRHIVPDISNQYSHQKGFDDYCELKMRALHAFQCSMLLKALNSMKGKKVTVADIGDSAGTHMLYLRHLAKDNFDIDTVSVDLDPKAIERIKGRGLKAILCRAENLDMEGIDVDLYAAFELVEHLHDPALFFRHLAKKGDCDFFVITVPFQRASRVGCYFVRSGIVEKYFAAQDHIFELSPEDWALLMLHSGWRIDYEQVYRQYPTKWPLLSRLLGCFWRRTDFEGFWGAVLRRDSTFADNYQDWAQ